VGVVLGVARESGSRLSQIVQFVSNSALALTGGRHACSHPLERSN
jgi:hypothetical protein